MKDGNRLRSRFRGAFAMLLCFVSLPTLASAQATDDERARTHFQSGRLYYEDGAYDRALAEFSSAYRLSHRPELLINMANANERLGQPEAAAQNLRAYLEAVPDAPSRANLERRIENLERLQQEREARAVAQATPDRAAGGEGADETEDLPPPAEEPARRRSLRAPLAAYGVGAAGFITLAVAGPLALSRDRSLADGCGATRSCTENDVASADRAALIADIGLGVGIVGAAVGTVLLLVRGRDSDEGASPTSFRFAPILARDVLGLSTELHF